MRIHTHTHTQTQRQVSPDDVSDPLADGALLLPHLLHFRKYRQTATRVAAEQDEYSLVNCLFSNTDMHVNACMHTQTHKHSHTHTNTNLKTCSHTHAHTQTPPPPPILWDSTTCHHSYYYIYQLLLLPHLPYLSKLLILPLLTIPPEARAWTVVTTYQHNYLAKPIQIHGVKWQHEWWNYSE